MSAATKPKPDRNPRELETQSFAQKLAPFRMDLICAGALVVLSILIWCTIYNRWSAETWKIPIFYPHPPAKNEDNFQREMDLSKGDVMQQFAIIKATMDGHMLPFVPTNIPELGAPYVANWDDYPITEKAIYWVLGIVAKCIGIFAAANFATLLEDVLAAVAFYATCRLLKVSWLWSFAGALVFAFARFGFAHGIHHIPTAFVWHVPLCILVFHWIIGKEGIHFHTKRFAFAIVVAFLTGIQNPYNTNMFAQLVLIGGLILWWRAGDRSAWRVCLPAVAIIGTAAAGFLFANSNTFLYHLMNGGNQGAVVRSFRWMEIYGLKLVDMVMPPPDHRFALFALWEKMHLIPRDPSEALALSPGEMPPTAYLGLISLAALGWLTLASLRRAVQWERLPIEAWLILWIYLYSDVGGINGVAGVLGFQLFRATTRYSLWILCIALMYGVRRMSAIDFKGWAVKEFGAAPWTEWFPYGIAFAAVLIALFDQTPPVTTQAELQELADAQASDRNFTHQMERNLPPNAMVFQFPIMLFPETPTTIGSYDNLRPYLYSRNLRYSFGTDKGRGTELWQMRIPQMPDFINKLQDYGFAGLYVNRDAFSDRGEGLFEKLKSLGYEVIESANKDLYCVVLKPSPHPILPNTDPAMRADLPAMP